MNFPAETAPIFIALAALPDAHIVLSGSGQSRTAAALRLDIDNLALRLQQHDGKVLAVLADNGPAWVTADLAALKAGLVHLPLPGFFSDDQLRHAVQNTGADLLLTDQPARVIGLGLEFHAAGQWDGLILLKRTVAAVMFPPGTTKISFTSGSTGQPKGVCLSAAGLLDTAQAVSAALADLPIDRHLCVLPLALLLENVAGVYAPLLRGAKIEVPRQAQLGWRGMSGFDPVQLARQVEITQPNSLILVPELLKAWTLTLQAGRQHGPASLKFIAVGGARCDPRLIETARELGLPAYEGYGLTECGSVVSLNRPGADQPGSVGQPLSHIRIQVNAEHEVRIESRAFLGYLNGAETTTGAFNTGDLGHLGPTGHLHLSGRRKNLIITAYGRNIAPEWVEAALLAQPEIAQAIVIGEAQPWLAALLTPMPNLAASDLDRAVARANATLPDYARVGGWLRCAPFTPENGTATGNGRPVRAAIQRQHAAAIESLYATHSTPHSLKEPAHVVL
jgi:long-subunit acyl-CoA synthetase (AMP-forming)